MKINDKINKKKQDNSNTYGKKEKDKLVKFCLKHAVFDGFSSESLKKACNDCNIDYANANALFPNPAKDIQAHWAIMLDEDTLEYAKKIDRNKRIRDNISYLVKHRIGELDKHKTCTKNVVAQAFLPYNTPTFTHQLWDTAHNMWIGIGDTTPDNDTNYYTKRLILSGVIGSSIMFWVSDEKNEVNEYIDRRIDDALKLGKIKRPQSLKILKQFSKSMPYINHPLKMRD